MDQIEPIPEKRHVEIVIAVEILAELIEAAMAGERIFLDRDGVPQVQLVVVGKAVDAWFEERWERKFGPEAGMDDATR